LIDHHLFSHKIRCKSTDYNHKLLHGRHKFVLNLQWMWHHWQFIIIPSPRIGRRKLLR